MRNASFLFQRFSQIWLLLCNNLHDAFSIDIQIKKKVLQLKQLMRMCAHSKREDMNN
jgi:hypothetical protein